MKKLLFILGIFLITLAACNKNPDLPMTDKDYKVGTDGLVFDFIDQAPPESLFEESEFEISSELWNKGAYTITDGYITAILESDYMCITDEGDDYENSPECIEATGEQGINPGITKRISDLEPEGDLPGKGVVSPQGNAKHLRLTARTKKLDLLSIQHTSPVILTACYVYITELSEDVCIDPNPTSLGEKVCNVQDISLSDQGAPLAITLIENRMIPANDLVKPQFLIHIKNKGIGQIINKDKLEEACTAQKLYREDYNRLVLSEFRFSNDRYSYVFTGNGGSGNIDCGPNPLRLTDGEDYIRCTLKEGIPKNTPPFETQAYMKFEYGYTNSVTKNVVIETIS